MKQGVWIASTDLYGVEVVCTAVSMIMAFKSLQKDLEYIELNLYRAVMRSEES